MQIIETVSKGWDQLTRTQELPDYALHYYDALKAQFETLQKPAPGDPAVVEAYANAEGVVGRPKHTLDWTDLMLLDLSIVRVLSFECLRLKVADLRQRLDGQAMPLPQDLSLKLESATPDKIGILRCEAETLVTRLWHTRIARNSRDHYVGELRRTVFSWMIGIGILLIVIAYVLKYVLNIDTMPLFFIIFTTGMMGALTSILRRLQAASVAVIPNLDQNSDLSALAYERLATTMSLFAGGVFAIILYIAFIAGLSDLSGNLAPKFEFPKQTPAGGMNFWVFVNDVGPASGQDYAKTVVWSFVAGFFEQFVPDVLDRLVKREKKA